MSTTPTPTSHHGPTRGRVLTIIAVVAALAVIVLLVVRANRTTNGSGKAQSPSPTGTASVTTSTTAPSSSSPATASPSPTRTTSTGTGIALIDQGYVPLYPFVGLDDAQAWQESYRSGGHQPWHLDAEETALSFTRGYLGFTELDRVVGPVRTDADGAHVDVGYTTPAGRAAVAATLHLMRLGLGGDAPWEVVGSDDTTFTLDVPAYASTISSPVRVGGVISGVDENVVVSVRQLGHDGALATSTGVPAGGDRQPWSVTVSYSGAKAGAVTLVARTGGHVQQVERFAITGAYTR